MSVGTPTVFAMATWDDVGRIALALPEVTEQPTYDGLLSWRVRDKLFVWERPLRRADREALGAAAPDGPILATRVADVGAKEALLAEDPAVHFITPHFDGYAIILTRLELVDRDVLDELLVEAWLTRAPKRLAAAYLADRP